MAATAPEPFLERDFLAYEKHRQKDPEYNALRLGVRRKLKALADRVKKEAKDLGYALDSQAGLHHPYSFNNFRVREQRAYLCRGRRSGRSWRRSSARPSARTRRPTTSRRSSRSRWTSRSSRPRSGSILKRGGTVRT